MMKSSCLVALAVLLLGAATAHAAYSESLAKWLHGECAPPDVRCCCCVPSSVRYRSPHSAPHPHPTPSSDCPASCDSSATCYCASNVAPGGLANGDVPQFIVLTNDDAVTVVSQPVILNITERHSNKNGCKMPAT